jgi:hypothetical protein
MGDDDGGGGSAATGNGDTTSTRHMRASLSLSHLSRPNSTRPRSNDKYSPGAAGDLGAILLHNAGGDHEADVRSHLLPRTGESTAALPTTIRRVAIT